MKYVDKHQNEIKEGMYIKHQDGDLEKVYGCGDDDVGLNAVNVDYIANHPQSTMIDEFFPLHQFDLSEWEIAEPRQILTEDEMEKYLLANGYEIFIGEERIIDYTLVSDYAVGLGYLPCVNDKEENEYVLI